MRKILAASALLGGLVGCGGGDPLDLSCDNEMDDVRAERGAPEEITTYNGSGYTSTTWHYWTKGISYTFQDSMSCEVSNYTFTPIK